MKGEYIQAIETRARWLNWANRSGYSRWQSIQNTQNILGNEVGNQESFLEAFDSYKSSLENGDTYYMNKEFCDMVENAKGTAPLDFEFDNAWMQSRGGFLYLETPFITPSTQMQEQVAEAPSISIRAIGWLPVNENKTYFMCFLSFDDYGGEGYGCWSHFTLETGQKLRDRITQFEKAAHGTPASYVPGEDFFRKHEIRWIYTAMFLMSQRLTHLSSVTTDRHTRKRAEKMKMSVTPFIRVVSLRRLEEERERAGVHKEANYQWRFVVRGHWRNQFYASENTHKTIFIEAYVKGPEDKPLKPPTHTLFIAGR